MDVPLGIAGLISVVLAVGHEVVGLTAVLRTVTEERLPATLFGPPSMTVAMLRVTWHLVSVFVLTFARRHGGGPVECPALPQERAASPGAVRLARTCAALLAGVKLTAGGTLNGWYPLTWSPGGDQLLVHDAATRRTLGVVDSADLGTVRPVGRVSGPAWDVDWFPA